METDDDIKDFLAGSPLGAPKDVSFMSLGENNCNYLVSDNDGGKYVLRSKRDVSTEGSLLNEHIVLSFLEQALSGFAPQSLLYDDDAGVHAISFVPGEEIGPYCFSPETAKAFARKLAKLHSVELDDYQKFREENGFGPAGIETLGKTFDTFFIQSFSYISEHCPDKELVDWIGPQVEAARNRVEAHTQWPPVFSHGDIGGNMMWDGKDLVFIDWERTRFMKSHELGYCFVHGRCAPDMQETVLRQYCAAAGYQGAWETGLRDEIDLQMRILRLDAVIWPAKRFSELRQAGRDDAQDYAERARANIKTFEKHYAG